MKYLLMIYDNEKSWEEADEAERNAIFGKHMTFTEEAQAAGVMVGGEALEPTNTATTVRKTGAHDGPFAETKEQLGGFYIVDCPNLDEALKWAKKLPESETGGIEVRPVMTFD